MYYQRIWTKIYKSLSQWLKENKLSLNISEIKLIIFHRNTTSIDQSFKFVLDGKRLSPSESVIYLWVLLGKYLQWNDQIFQVKIKLNCAIGILSKIRHNANPIILKVVYHFTLQRGKLCGQTYLANQNLI